LNYFEYRPRQAFLSNLTFNAINAEQSGGPDLENFTMAVSEQVNDEGARGGWFFDVGDAGTYNPVLFAPGSEYLGYSGTDSSVWFEHFAYWWESGYVSWRGSVGRIYGSTEASISYALSLAHAKYSLEKLSSSIITAPSPKPTVKPTTVVKPTAAPKTKGKTGVGVAGAPPEIQNLGAPVFAAVGAALVLVALAYYWVWTKKKK
jgi:hypothetical protein